MSTPSNGNKKKTPINVRNNSENAYSGFVIVRLSPEAVSTDSNDISELAKKKNIQSLTNLLDKYKSYNITSRPLVKNTPSSKIMELESKSLKRKSSHSLTSYWRLDTRKLSENKIKEFIKELNESQEIDLAYRERSATDPSVNPTDDRYFSLQNYLDAAPVGIDARYAWSRPNGMGNEVGIIDLEQGWLPNHEDLIDKNPTLIFNNNRDGVNSYKGNHGAAVLGEIVGVDNNLGIIGIAPGVSSVRMVSHYEAATNTAGHVADAILAALEVMSPGDALLLEIQKGLLPTEIEQADFDAIRLAVDSGIIVIEAAGNGSYDLDNETNESELKVLNRNSQDFLDSGAIMVGAAESILPHNRAEFSNYGSRIDCYGWGENIVTVGYGDLDDGLGSDNRTYTSNFGGTSGASPIITGAVLILQSIHQHEFGIRLTPDQMRTILSNPTTGTSQGPEPGHIGVMPNLRAIVENLLKTART
jgi:subtilisin family serine protease